VLRSHESPKKKRQSPLQGFQPQWQISITLFFPTPCKMDSLIDFSKTSLYWSLGSVLFNPIFWNVVARAGKILRFFFLLVRSSNVACPHRHLPLEYRKQVLTRLACGNPYLGCYGLAVTIFSLGIFRDFL
jgi:methylene-fatty-acyl-phospholipid synthase